MVPAISNRRYVPALDGIRGIAIILVVLYHNFGFIKTSYFGWLGVDLFFVLSGFLITSILLDQSGQPGFLKNFFMRRVLRIFPLYYLCLLIFLVIFPAFGFFTKQLNYFTENQWWLWTYLQNWLYSLHPSQEGTMLTHFWSLAVEEQFYIIWPLIILFFKRPKRLVIVMLGILLLTIAARSIVWFYHIEDLNYTTLYTFTRIDGICIGSIVAILMKINPELISKNLAIIATALAAINFGFYFLNEADKDGYPYYAFVGYTTFCSMFGLAVHEVVNSSPTNIPNRILSVKPLRFLGKISYGFYIFHWPIFVMTNGYFFSLVQSETGLNITLSRLLAAILSTGLALILSVISYYSFERYFLQLKDKYK